MKVLITISSIVVLLACVGRETDKSFNHFLFVNFKPDSTISLKIAGGDTLFREVKTNNSVFQSYKVLSSEDQHAFYKHLSEFIRLNRSTTSFSAGIGEQLIVISFNDSFKYFSISGDEIGSLKGDLIQWLQIVSIDADYYPLPSSQLFWNVPGIVEPPAPPQQLDSNILNFLSTATNTGLPKAWYHQTKVIH